MRSDMTSFFQKFWPDKQGNINCPIKDNKELHLSEIRDFKHRIFD